jgi:hypothetical protein
MSSSVRLAISTMRRRTWLAACCSCAPLACMWRATICASASSSTPLV